MMEENEVGRLVAIFRKIESIINVSFLYFQNYAIQQIKVILLRFFGGLVFSFFLPKEDFDMNELETN